MKKTIKSLLALFAVAMTIASCSNEVAELASQEQSGELVPVTFSATRELAGGDAATRTYLSPDATHIYWESTDKVIVYDTNTKCTKGHEFSVIPSETDKTFATLSGEVCAGCTKFTAATGSAGYADTYSARYVMILAEQKATANSFYKEVPMVSAAEGDYTKEIVHFNFKTACAFLKVTTTQPYTKIEPTYGNTSTNPPFGGPFVYDASTGELNGSFSYKSVSLIPSSGSTIPAGTYYICIRTGSFEDFGIKCYSDASTVAAEKTKSGTVTFARNTIYDLGTFGSDPNLIAGKFSVSATKQVQFSKSNLYWDGSTYHFESTQTSYPSSWNANHVGHFYWTSAEDYATGTAAYMPYSYSYSKNSSTSTSKFWCGEENPLSVDGTSGLYSLTVEEWDYLLHTRTNASKLYRIASVNGCNYSIVLAPDDFTGTLKSSYTLSEINELGLVCIPNTGRNRGVTDTTHGYIWTASTDNSQSPRIYFHDSSVDIEHNHGRDGAYIIRLVKNAQS